MAPNRKVLKEKKMEGQHLKQYCICHKEGAYWHGNFIPIKRQKINWFKVWTAQPPPHNGRVYTMFWKPFIPNPENGWLQNCNSTPYSVMVLKRRKTTI
jgi:hypothetical protein